jgi:hypothetical protein
MNNKLIAVALALAVLNGGGAAAQWQWFQWISDPVLSKNDLAIIRKAVREEIHGKPAGTVAKWANPATGHSGTITLISKSVHEGMPCERIKYQIASSTPGDPFEQYLFTSCRLPDGTWKIAY